MNKNLLSTVLLVALILIAVLVALPLASAAQGTPSRAALAPANAINPALVANLQPAARPAKQAYAAPLTGANFRAAPQYDATGALLSDPSGLAAAAKAEYKVAPLFDSRGAMISDPAGTVLGAVHATTAAVPLIAADFKAAPVYAADGRLVADPSGVILPDP